MVTPVEGGIPGLPRRLVIGPEVEAFPHRSVFDNAQKGLLSNYHYRVVKTSSRREEYQCLGAACWVATPIFVSPISFERVANSFEDQSIDPLKDKVCPSQ
jgi:hypothetical protein